MNWTARRVINFAHQGGSFEGPSSTLFAIERALAHGATAVELDVHATRDRHLVVCHDETVDRTTQGRGRISEHTLDELRELDNAYWWAPGSDVSPGLEPDAYPLRGRAPGDRRLGVATLAEVAAAFPDVLLNLDIKETDPDVEPYEALLYDELRALECTDRVIVASFHDRALANFRALAPGVATSAATQETAAFYFSVLAGAPVAPPVAALQVPDVYEGVPIVTADFVAAAHEADVAVHVWTINDEATMTALLDLGVDGIITDVPSLLNDVLRARGGAWAGALN